METWEETRRAELERGFILGLEQRKAAREKTAGMPYYWSADEMLAWLVGLGYFEASAHGIVNHLVRRHGRVTSDHLMIYAEKIAP